jgi:predicted nucleotide-binding protein
MKFKDLLKESKKEISTKITDFVNYNNAYAKGNNYRKIYIYRSHDEIPVALFNKFLRFDMNFNYEDKIYKKGTDYFYKDLDEDFLKYIYSFTK